MKKKSSRQHYRPFWQITLRTPENGADDFAALLVDAQLGGVEILSQDLFELPRGSNQTSRHAHQRPPRGQTDLVVTFTTGTKRNGALTEIAKIGETLGVTYKVMACKLRRDQGWSEKWKQFYKPLKIGRQLWIVPSWLRRTFKLPKKHRALTLDPGMAFGTGQHPTTRLCLQIFDHVVRAGGEVDLRELKVLDVGCGSGILALAALFAGAQSAMGLDNDPLATEATVKNARINRLNERIQVSLRPLTTHKRSYPLVFANIIAPVLSELATDLVRCTKGGGVLILSGLLQEQETMIVRRFRQAAQGQKRSARVIIRQTEKDWLALALQI